MKKLVRNAVIKSNYKVKAQKNKNNKLRILAQMIILELCMDIMQTKDRPKQRKWLRNLMAPELPKVCKRIAKAAAKRFHEKLKTSI